MINDATWSYERQRLQRTRAEITSQLEEIQHIVGDRRSDVVTIREEMWVDLPKVIRDFDDAIVFNQHQQLLDQQEREYLIFKRLIPRLERLATSAYFGRIDFRPAGETETNQVYIGIASLVERETGEHLIYDWRAPISSMFYDFEPGPVHYRAAEGDVHGDMLLKRQYKIEGDQIVYLFDTELKIDDDLLQSILGRTVEPTMRTIVQSIQREQNRAIRDEHHRLLVVSGPAGSGKTSIALHRVAYLLYRQRGRIRSSDIVIVSPNDVFNDYISRVLPDLGEENARQVTFVDCIRTHLKGLSAEEYSEHLEQLLTEEKKASSARRAAEITLKGSPQFYDALVRYAKSLNSGEGIPFESIEYQGKQIISREEILTLLRETYAYLPFRNRLEKLKRRILYLLEPLEKSRLEQLKRDIAQDPNEPHLSNRELNRKARRIVAEETLPIKERINRWTSFSTLVMYARFFRDPKKLHRWTETKGGLSLKQIQAICHATRRRLKHRRLAYEDVAPFLCLKGLLGDLPSQNDVKHVVIDEAQDYTLCHFAVFKHLFPQAEFTVLGDPDQSIHPYIEEPQLHRAHDALAVEPAAAVDLKTSYRSTQQIVRFAREILPREGYDVVERGGDKPTLFRTADEGATIRALRDEIDLWHQSQFAMTAIICKTAKESRKVYDLLSTHLQERPLPAGLSLHLITSAEDRLQKGVVVIPSYLSKGLEFDAVALFDASASSYGNHERRLFYTVCTRALHRLTLMVAGEPSPLLTPVNPDTYVERTLASPVHP